MSDLKVKTFKLDSKDRKVLRMVARRLGVKETQAIRWSLRFYAIYGPCWPKGDVFPGEVLRHYRQAEIGPNGQEVSV